MVSHEELSDDLDSHYCYHRYTRGLHCEMGRSVGYSWKWRWSLAHWTSRSMYLSKWGLIWDEKKEVKSSFV